MTTTLEKQTTKTCPQCQAMIPVTPGYVTWCDQCNWNVQPEKQMESRTIFEKMYWRVGKKVSKRLLDTMVETRHVKPTLSVSKIFALILAAMVHLSTLTLLVGGFYLLIAGFPHPIMMIIGAIMLLFAWFVRPKPYQPTSPFVKREKFPTLYTVVDDISGRLSDKKVHGIIVDKEFNASFSQIGWRRRQVLGLGLPLVSVLDKQELVALIAHELGHGLNGDPNRSFFVWSAINTLSAWYNILQARDNRKQRRNQMGFMIRIAAVLTNFLFWLLSLPVQVLIYLITYLNLHNSQRAEFLADRHAASAAGKEAKLSMLTKLHLEGLFQFSVSKAVNNKKSGVLWDVFQEQVNNMPERELERMNRVNLLTGARLDATHPPTANRIAFIQSLSVRYPLYELSDEMHKRLMDELSALKPSIEEEVVADYRNQLYQS